MTEDKTIRFNNVTDIASFHHWHNKPIEILEILADPKADNPIDACCLPQFRARLVETGEINTVEVDEIDEKHWGDEMKAVLAGLAKALDNKDSPYEQSHPKHFQYGIEIAEYK